MKPFERRFRERHLTPGEVAADQELRGKVEREYPPKTATNAAENGSLGELLRRSIRESGRSVEEIATGAGVSPIVSARFVSNERDIHMATACQSTGAVIVPRLRGQSQYDSESLAMLC